MNDEERNFKCWFAVQYHQQPLERQAAWRRLYPAMFEAEARRALLDELDTARMQWLEWQERRVNMTPRQLAEMDIQGYHDCSAALQRYVHAVRALEVWDNANK